MTQERASLAPNRRAWWRGTTALAVAILIAGLGTSSPNPASAVIHLALDRDARLSLPTMSTGEIQDLVVSGVTAQKRNAQIPVSASLLDTAPSFSDIRVASPYYSTALKCLTQAIYYEAANEPEAGKRAVAQVVINRLRHPEYPNSICGVVYEGSSAPVCQFSFTCDGSLLRVPLARQWEDARRVAREALSGRVEADVGSATHYHADYVLPRWAFTLSKVAQVGRHIFYRFPGSIGSAAALTDSWTGLERIPSLDFARLRGELEVQEASEDKAEPPSGLAASQNLQDRHAAFDVGGRLEMKTEWRLAIPDPTELSASYRSTLSKQAGGTEIVTPEDASDSETFGAPSQ